MAGGRGGGGGRRMERWTRKEGGREEGGGEGGNGVCVCGRGGEREIMERSQNIIYKLAYELFLN